MDFKKTAVILALILAALPLGACGTGKNIPATTPAATIASEVGDDAVIFTVGDLTMKKNEFMAYVTSYLNSDYTMSDAKQYAREDATNNMAVIAVAKAMGLEYTDEMKQAKEEQKQKVIDAQGGEEGYEAYLQTLGVDDSFIDFLLDAQYSRDLVFGDELSDEAKRTYFDEYYFRAKHILLATMDTSTQEKYDDAKIAEQKALADELLQRAQNGEDFDTLMNEYSEDPGSKSNPDGYFFTYGEMVTEFEEEVESLKENGIGECESDYGYHVIKRLPLKENEEAYEEAYQSAESSIEQTLEQNCVATELPGLLLDNNLEIVTDYEVYDSIQ